MKNKILIKNSRHKLQQEFPQCYEAFTQYVPFKKISKYKLKFKTKPWIIFGVQKSSMINQNTINQKQTIEEIHQLKGSTNKHRV